MNWKNLLFSFQGRINRAKYWLTWLIYSGILILFFVYFFIGVGVVSAARSAESAVKYLTVAVLIIFTIAVTWSGVATGIKRLHDREKNGWWIAVFWLGPSVLGGIQAMTNNPMVAMTMGFGSFALAFWGFVELGCLRGTTGSNFYGPDPLETYNPVLQR